VREEVTVVFIDRVDAGGRLAARLAYLRNEPVVVLGLPRDGVPVAFELARALDTPPTLLVVSGDDEVVLDLNRYALARLRCEKRLTVVPGATHLFEEPGTLPAAAEAARDRFVSHLKAILRQVGRP
jgi:putative phosphoribosyl transferase